VIVLDTSGLLAAIDGSQRLHRAAADVLRTVPGPRVLSPFVLAELDYLLTRRVSTSAAAALLGEVATGAYRLEAFDQNDVSRAGEIIERYRDLEIGLTDASLVVLAERYRTWDLLTLDERHFRAVTGPDGRAFRILPADA
jgi:predicted nucleic acid-binding protein